MVEVVRENDRELLRTLGIDPDEIIAERQLMLENAIKNKEPDSVVRFLRILVDQ